jgi:peptidyl-prolyl cis-trans isomerase A (cyclophilin A)
MTTREERRAMRYLATTGLAVLGLLALPMAATVSTAAAADEKPRVELDTSLGKITLELDPEKAPITVENFLKYVDEGFYNGTTFHRVIGPSQDDPQGFMVQAGGYTSDMREKQGTRPGIKNESGNGLENKKGTIAMGLLPNRPDSATSQFYINLKDNTHLDARGGRRGTGYAVFGKVVDGMDVVDKIARVRTGAKAGHEDVPLEPIVIKSARRKPKS